MISKEIENKIINYFMPYEPVKIGLFGSRVRGDNREDSDLDILYSIDKRISLLDLVRMERELKSVLNMKVDLVENESITNQRLREYILKDLKIIYAKG